MTEKRRVLEEPMFLLHHRPYSETSLLMDGFSRNYGRVALIAKGVKKKKSRTRGLLLQFQKLVVSWSGRAELKTIIDIEMFELETRLTKERLFCGYYINELLLRTLIRGDPYERLFDCYESALNGLRSDSDLERILRIFENRLLQELGYGLHLDSDSVSGRPIDSNTRYVYLLENGPIEDQGEKGKGISISGESLIALEKELHFSPKHRQELKQLTRAALDVHLGGRPLHSRTLYSQLFSNNKRTVSGDEQVHGK